MTNKPTLIAAFGLLTLLGAAGCNRGSESGYKPAEPAKTVEPVAIDAAIGEKIWPMAVGNQWTFDVETTQMVEGGQSRNLANTITFRVAKVEPMANGKKIVLESWEGATRPEKPSLQGWQYTDKGLFQAWVGDPSRAYNPPQPSVPFPLEQGSVLKYKGSGPLSIGGTGAQENELTVRAPQLVDSGAGQFSAATIETAGTFETTITENNKPKKVKGVMSSVTFVAPNVGLVRFRQEMRVDRIGMIQVIRLKSFTVK